MAIRYDSVVSNMVGFANAMSVASSNITKSYSSLADERSEKNLKSNVSLKEEALCFSRGRFTEVIEGMK